MLSMLQCFSRCVFLCFVLTGRIYSRPVFIVCPVLGQNKSLFDRVVINKAVTSGSDVRILS